MRARGARGAKGATQRSPSRRTTRRCCRSPSASGRPSPGDSRATRSTSCPPTNTATRPDTASKLRAWCVCASSRRGRRSACCRAHTSSTPSASTSGCGLTERVRYAEGTHQSTSTIPSDSTQTIFALVASAIEVEMPRLTRAAGQNTWTFGLILCSMIVLENWRYKYCIDGPLRVILVFEIN